MSFIRTGMLFLSTGAALAIVAACDGGDGSGGGGLGDTMQDSPGTADRTADETGGEDLWTALPGATLADVTRVVAFTGAAGALYVSIESPVSAGLFRLDPAGPAAGFVKVFEAVGLTLATEAGTYVATWANKAGALIQVGEGGEGLDLGFNFEQREIQRMIYTDGLLYLLSKDWAAAEYHVNRGSAAAMQWDQVGPVSNETALGFHTDGDSIAMVTVRNEVPLGLNCRTIAANAGEDGAWAECTDFPQHLAGGPNDPYSVKAGVAGSGTVMVSWFEVLKAGQKTWEVQVGSIGGGWGVADGLPADRAPSAMLVSAGTVFVAYQGLGEGRQVFVRSGERGERAETLVSGGGLPEPSGDKSGVVGMASVEGDVFALWQDYNAGGSSVAVFSYNR